MFRAIIKRETYFDINITGLFTSNRTWNSAWYNADSYHETLNFARDINMTRLPVSAVDNDRLTGGYYVYLKI